MAVRVTALKDGPLMVAGECKVYDSTGTEVADQNGSAILLCRCGKSENKPFCDGSHVRLGFRE